MSILLSLYKQNLIRQRNDAQFQMLRNNAQMMNFMGTHRGRTDFSDINNSENAIALDNLSLSTRLAVANAELKALDRSGLSLNYFA